MTDKLTKIIFILSFVSVFVAYTFFEVVKQKYNIKIYYPLTALAFVGFTYSFYRTQVKGGFKTFSKIVYLSALSNLIDELFFNPREIQINEYIGFLIIIIVTIINDDRRRRTNG